MSFEPLEYLRHIAAEADYLVEQTASISKEDFLNNETLRRAFVRRLEVIGEAAKKLPDEFRAKHPQVEWRAMAGMRDRLIDGYFGVDHDLVWEVATQKIPTLRREISRILKAGARIRTADLLITKRRLSGRPRPTRSHGEESRGVSAWRRSRLGHRCSGGTAPSWPQERGHADAATGLAPLIIDQLPLVKPSAATTSRAWGHAGARNDDRQTALEAHSTLHETPNVRRRALLPVVKERTQLADALARYLNLLGLERRSRPMPSLNEYLQGRAGEQGRAPES